MHGRQELQRERGRTSVGRLARHTRRACTRGARTRAGAGTSLSAPLTPPRRFPPATKQTPDRHRRPDSLKAGHAGASDSEQESIGDRQQQHAHGHGHGGGERPPADPPSSATLLLPFFLRYPSTPAATHSRA